MTTPALTPAQERTLLIQERKDLWIDHRAATRRLDLLQGYPSPRFDPFVEDIKRIEKRLQEVEGRLMALALTFQVDYFIGKRSNMRYTIEVKAPSLDDVPFYFELAAGYKHGVPCTFTTTRITQMEES